MRIQNNIPAMNTHRRYKINNDKTAKSAEKLASGYRINRAGDDAAGLAISEKMRSQIRGLNMATKNSQDAISLVQTAEGALQETQNMLQRMNELAVQAATGTNEELDRSALAKEFEQLKREINDVAEQTNFNDMKILDGSLSYKGYVRSTGTGSITTVMEDLPPLDKQTPVSKLEDITGIPGYATIPEKKETAVFSGIPEMSKTLNELKAASTNSQGAVFTFNISGIKNAGGTLQLSPIVIDTNDSTFSDSETLGTIFASRLEAALQTASGTTQYDVEFSAGSLTVSDTAAGNLVFKDMSVSVQKEDSDISSVLPIDSGAAMAEGGSSPYQTAAIDFSGLDASQLPAVGSTVQLTISDGNITFWLYGEMREGITTFEELFNNARREVSYQKYGVWSRAECMIRNGQVEIWDWTGTPTIVVSNNLEAELRLPQDDGSNVYVDVPLGPLSIPKNLQTCEGNYPSSMLETSKAGEKYTFEFVGADGTKAAMTAYGDGKTSIARLLEERSGLPDSVIIERKDASGNYIRDDSQWHRGYFSYRGGKYQFTIKTQDGDGYIFPVGTSGTVSLKTTKAEILTLGKSQYAARSPEIPGEDSTPASKSWMIRFPATGTSDSNALEPGTKLLIYGQEYVYRQSTSGTVIDLTKGEFSDLESLKAAIEAMDADAPFSVTVDNRTGTLTFTAKQTASSPTADLANGIFTLYEDLSAVDVSVVEETDEAENRKTTLTFAFDNMQAGDGLELTVDGNKKITVLWESMDTQESFLKRLRQTIAENISDPRIYTDGNAAIAERVALSAAVTYSEQENRQTNALRIQVGALENEQLSISIDSMNTAALGLDRQNLYTQDSAGHAITAVRTAINKVSDQRATLGAMQNRLEHKISNLKVTTENLSAAESRIRDVDMASEMTQFTQDNILSQAATAMLAQANSMPQNVLSLLGQ